MLLSFLPHLTRSCLKTVVCVMGVVLCAVSLSACVGHQKREQHICIQSAARAGHPSSVTCFTPRQWMERNWALKQAALKAQMTRAGIQVVQQGSRLQLIIPVDTFFLQGRAVIRVSRINTLDTVASYIQHYASHTTVDYPIKVYGYTDNLDTWQRRTRLGQAYAEAVAAFLWRHGFSITQLDVMPRSHGVAEGSDHPTPEQRAWHRRVMIQVN